MAENQSSNKGDKAVRIPREEQRWFDQNFPNSYKRSSNKLDDILDNDGGFLVDGELKIVAEVRKLKNVTNFVCRYFSHERHRYVFDSMVELVTHIFERHPEIASEFRLKNPNLRTGYMSLLLSLIESLLYSPHELQKADLAVAYTALESMTEAGFKLDWLEKKLDEMSGKKKKEKDGERRMQEIENELKDLKQKCSDLETELEKERGEVSAAKAPISFDDVF